MPFIFAGPGVSGTLDLTYGSATDAKYPQAFEVTAISGTFTDTNNGLNIVNTPILGIVPINFATPEAINLLAPNDFSKFLVTNSSHGSLSYDNLYYPGGSPQTASDYTLKGGVLDIYGLMFNIAGGRVVNVWSNGSPSGDGQGAIYGVAVATRTDVLDYQADVAPTPEPGTFVALSAGLIAVFVRRRFAHSR